MPNCRRTPSGRWRAEYRDIAGRKRSRTFDRKADAERWRAGMIAAIQRGDYVDPVRGRMKFSDWAWQWLSSAQHLSPSSYARVEIALRNELVPSLGNCRLTAIDHEMVQEIVNSLVRRGQAPATVRKTYNVLSSIMGAAVSANRVLRSPCQGIRLPKLTPRQMRFLSAEELHRLAHEVPDRYRALVFTAGYLGPRWSEVVGLRSVDISLLERRLTISHTLVEVRGHLHSGPPKSAKGVRTLTVPGFVADIIGEHLGRYPAAGGWVFAAPEGGPLRRHFVRRVFKPAAERAHLAPLRWHDLRHTSAGLAIAVGAHPKVIQERLGHSSIKVTLDTYGHLFPNLDQALSEALDELARQAAAAHLPPDADPGLQQLSGVGA
jgi:integrase